MPIINLAEQVREIPVAQILQAEGFKSDRQGQSIMFKDDNHSINVTGQKWFDHKNDKGGYGAIDLAIHLNQTDFRQACLWLADRYGSNHQTNLSFPVAQSSHKHSTPPQPKESFEEQRARLAIDSPENKKIVFEYLTQTRGIESKYIDQNFVRATRSKDLPMLHNATFLHRNLDGEVKGLSSRSTLHQTGGKSCLGSKTFAWFTTMDLKKSASVVLTESPIEALSLANLAPEITTFEPKQPVCYLSVSGNSVPENLAQYLVQSKKEVVLALNSDLPGIQGTARAKETFSKLGYSGEIQILTPEGKDWNSDLREYRSEVLTWDKERTLADKFIKSGEIQKRDDGMYERQEIIDKDPRNLVWATDKTDEEIRQENWKETLEIARKHKANLILERAEAAGFKPSPEQKETVLKSDWKALKEFEIDLSKIQEVSKTEVTQRVGRVEKSILESKTLSRKF
jgi:hypothetical protein